MMADSFLSPNPTQPDSRSRAVSDADTILPDGTNPFLTPSGTTAAPSAAPSFVLEDPNSALHPDPGTEHDFRVDNNPFAFSPGQLNKLLNPKSLSAFRALGGLHGIARGIQTDVCSGLSVDETGVKSTITFNEAVDSSLDSKPSTPPERHVSSSSSPFADRTRVYGRNVLPPKKGKSIWQLMYVELSEKVIILLTVAGIISLALGLYETLGVERPAGAPASVDWVEGVAICAAVIIVVVVGSHNNWQKEKAFVRLNTKKDDRLVKVIRSGRSVMINVNEILVGEVLHLEPGDMVPTDGILIEGQDVKCDESSATGESDVLKKTGGDQVMKLLNTKHNNLDDLDPFIISGSKVLEGIGTYVCTSVGVHSSFGKIMMSVRYDVEATPLQKKLEGLAVAIAKLGGGASALMFFILLFRFVADLPNDPRPPADKASTFMDLLVVAIAIIAVAVPEGLPLAVTLALAFATTKLLKENNLVRVLRACETMGNATTICSDKTGTLTTNKMTVVAGTFANTSFTALSQSENEKTPNAVPVATWAANIPEATKKLVVQSVAINSTAFEGEEDGQATFIGSKTETALLSLAKDHLGLQSLAEARANEQVVQMLPFDSSRKCMAAVIELRDPTRGYRLLVKGASEILLGYCSTQVNLETLDEEALDSTQRQALDTTINQYASRSLRTIGLVYKDYAQWPPAGMPSEDGHVKLDSLVSLSNLTFLGIVGIQDPVRPGVPDAVRKAQHAGVTVRMVTGDNVITAQAIATECGIYTGGEGVIMEGPVFRKLSEPDMNALLPKLQVLARSSPEDKRILVTRLKALGETVAVTGDGTNDAPALKAADVGFSMGISGTEVAKEASAIVLMDDNFTSIVTALKWGRAVNDAVQKFLQFQITVNITAVMLAFITAMYSSHMEPVLKAVQLLWVNLIMDTFAALALATDPPTEKILDRPPQPKSAPLITINMWKMIIGQAIFQLVITIVLYFAGPEILNYNRNSEDEMLQLDTIIFNTFVWMQIFNEFNNRRLDNKFNVLEGVHRNQFFIFINLLMVGLQVGIVFVGGRVFEIKERGLNGNQWAICIVIAFMSIPWGVVVRIFPDIWFEKVAKFVGKPFVLVYRFLGKVFSGIGGLFKRKQKTKDTESFDVPATVVVAPPEEKGTR
ncbi:calcium-translocating P-type ATPase [Colletotrichum karsti]|uniref:Calcium-transporting ATPase n=1 Tax=Colletotrichum karsti TaxID=1095194 RepID=A0A9P6LF68_9PEZI|nr:calcium-translocating P-type ATPase [Colletotrichum karsti]KAF9870871.1 calcium-translocating P-type ATPase [Colletotrichum karsti]